MKKKSRWDAYVKRIPKDRPIIGAEIGVWRGKNAEKLLALRPKLTLILVDRWEPPKPGDSYYLSDNTAQASAEEYREAYMEALERTEFADDRTRIIKRPSHIAAQSIDDHSLDFVLIDGDHSYEGVKCDIQCWLPKIKPGGLICGHDWKKRTGVPQAVTELLGHMAIERDDGSTWFVWLR